MEKRKLTNNTVKLVIVSICLAISSLISALYIAIVVKIIINDRNISVDPEYAMYVANGEVVTKKYDIENGDTLRFFSDFEGRRTLFNNAVPSLKIINDTESYVEVTSNSEFHDAVDISSDEGTITVKCLDSLYNKVHEDDPEYDYDYGLYVDCTELEIVVHSPISSLYTHTNLNLDFDVAKADEVMIHFSFEGVNGTIRNIDAENLNLYCSGTSKLELDGNVRNTAKIMLWHNSHINARKLSVNQFDVDVSRAIGGFSYLACEKWYQFRCDGGPTNIIEFFVFVPTICWICAEVKFVKKRKLLANQNDKQLNSIE
ncbi:MAG: DUF2807 domain-containing protein [Clostridia bacterium]|nr:DUF2807 domain-containing protein [Clostridia bacterium]